MLFKIFFLNTYSRIIQRIFPKHIFSYYSRIFSKHIFACYSKNFIRIFFFKHIFYFNTKHRDLRDYYRRILPARRHSNVWRFTVKNQRQVLVRLYSPGFLKLACRLIRIFRRIGGTYSLQIQGYLNQRHVTTEPLERRIWRLQLSQMRLL